MPTSKHFTKRIYDDIVTRESVQSPLMMEKTTSALELSYALGTEDGAERFAGTRYHFNDSYKGLKDRGVPVRLYDGTVGNCGDLKKPVLWSAEFMAEMRRKMGPYTFACQIMQNPKADATHGFKREWLEFWTPDDAKGLNVYLLRDAANSKKDEADYTVDWLVGLGPDENLYGLAVYRDRLNLTERTDQLFELVKRWKPIEIRYEEYGMQGDIAHVKGEMDKRKYRFKIIKVSGRMPKPERIKRLIPLFEAHRVILPASFHVTTRDHETKDMVHEFVENEYMAFPVPVHFDMLDSLSRICDTEGHVAHLDGRDEKVKLKLKWPDKKPAKIEVPAFPIKDRGIGY
jgi:phage terminase large subunit-like protein